MERTAAKAPRLLHLGCGLIAPPEWVNVDGSWNAWLARHSIIRKVMIVLRLLPRSSASINWPTNVTRADLRKRLPFSDADFDAVFSSHTVEHLYRDQALELLREAHRVLRPGGYCRTLVPDMKTIVQEYLGQMEMKWFSDEDEAALRPDPCRRMCSRLLMRDAAAPRGNPLIRLYRAATDYHAHKWMYDGPSLVKLMEEAGFADCRERGLHDSSILHIDKVESERRVLKGVGVVVEGRKA